MLTQLKNWSINSDSFLLPALPLIGFWISLISGLLLLFIIPPFQAPDEVNHFYKIYHVSEGNWATLKKDNRVGGDIPQSIVEIAQYFSQYRFHPNPEISYSELDRFSEIPLNPDVKVMQDFPNTGMYNPVCYGAYLFPMYLMIQLEVKPLIQLYVLRFISVLTWSIALFFCLKWLTQFRLLFFLLSTLPMAFFIHASVSADVLLNALVFLFISFVFRVFVARQGLTWTHYGIVFLFIVSISSIKLVYAPILLLLALWPLHYFKSRARQIFTWNVWFLISLATIIFWAAQSGKIYTPYELYNPAYRAGLDLTEGANMNYQIHQLSSHPGNIIKVIYLSTVENAQNFAESYIGRLGWNLVRIPLGMVLLSYLMIALVCLQPISIGLARFQNIFIIGIAFFTTWVLIILSQYVTWEVVNAQRVYLLQGRYFISLFPLLFIGIRLLIPFTMKIPTWIFIGYAGVSSLSTLWVIYSWYY